VVLAKHPKLSILVEIYLLDSIVLSEVARYPTMNIFRFNFFVLIMIFPLGVYGSTSFVGKKKSSHKITNQSCNYCQVNPTWDKLFAIWHMELI
jgi:hypothetical protein